MASYNELLALIDAYINQNGVQAITGQVLNGVLRAMVDQLGRGYTIMGAAVPTTDPGTPDGPESWFASTPGTYTDMGGLTVANAELALLSYTPSDGWAKTTLTQGIVSTSASVNNQVGTPSVTSSYVDGVLTFTFENLKGDTGDPAGFGAITASVDDQIGTPSVAVQTSGPDTAKAIAFQFHNLKGETGVTSVVATVDNTVGSPSCAVSLVGQVLHLDFTGLKGAQGDTGSSVDYPFTIVNNLTTNDATQALSAAQGVVLAGQVSQLEHKVDGNEFALFNEGKLSARYVDNEYVDQNSGNFITYNGWSRTDYLNVGLFKSVKITTTKASVYNAFYDKNKNWVISFVLSLGDNLIQIPDNACYLVISTNTINVKQATITIEEYRFTTMGEIDDTFDIKATEISPTIGQSDKFIPYTTSGTPQVEDDNRYFISSPIQVKKGDFIICLCTINYSITPSVLTMTDANGNPLKCLVPPKQENNSVYRVFVPNDGYLVFSCNDSYTYWIRKIESGIAATLFGLIPEGGGGDVTIVDNLYEGGSDKALSAQQGVVLKRLSDLNGNINDYPCVPSPVFKPYISRMPIDPASWSAGNNGTIDADKVEIFDEVNKCYRKSIKMNCYPLASGNNYSIFSATLSSPVNIKTTAMVGSIYLDPTIADADRGSILIRLYSGGNTANSATIYLWYLVDSSAGRTLYSRNYWYHFAINAYAAINSKTSGFDETNVTGFSIIYQNGYNTSPYIAVSDFGFVAQLHKPAICIVVDNYNPSVPDMADYAKSKGIKLTTTIVPSFIGGAGSATLDRINDGKLQGNLIGNHTWSHQASMTTEAEYIDEIVKAERYMLANGFVRGCKFISVPSATFNNLKYLSYCQTDAQMIYHNWVKGPQSLVDYPFYPCQRELNITVVDNNPDTAEAAAAVVATMKQNIQEAITYKGMSVLGFHGTFWEADNGVAWKDLIDYIAELSGVDVVTVDEHIEGTIV